MDHQRSQKIPLTKAQLQTQAGTELLALCQTITEDGSVSDAEIAGLKEWLDENRGSDLPSVAFLISTVEKILADGRVDEFERRDLHRALERVLPPDDRRKAIEARTEAELQEHMHNPRALFAPWRVGEVFDFMVAGVSYEGRAGVAELVQPDDPAYFVRDRKNKFSRNAIEVRINNGLQVGYVPEELAKELAPRLDHECKYHAWFKKVLRGSRLPIPVVMGELLRVEADIPVALREGHLPKEACGFRSIALLRSVNARDAADAITKLEPFVELLRADVESLSHRALELSDLESFVGSCVEVVPELRSYLSRHDLLASSVGAVSSVENAVRNVLAQVRPALEPLRADRPARVELLLRRMDAAFPAWGTASRPAPQPPPTAAQENRRNNVWLTLVLLLALVALAAALVVRGL